MNDLCLEKNGNLLYWVSLTIEMLYLGPNMEIDFLMAVKEVLKVTYLLTVIVLNTMILHQYNYINITTLPPFCIV